MTEFIIDEDFHKNQFEFGKRFNTEQACRDYLGNIKWPDGFRCRSCGRQKYWISAKGLYICTRCEALNSLTADTVMHGTKKPSLMKAAIRMFKAWRHILPKRKVSFLVFI